MVGLREPFARVEPRACQRLVPLRRRDRHHQVTAHEPDRVLHAALLVARVRVAEPRLEPVLRAEPLEHHGLRDRAVRVAVPHARGVVEHHHARRHPDTREHLAQPVAHTPRRLTRQRRDIPHVRIRVRDHQEMHHTLHARDRRACLAEIHLRGPRRPREPRIPLRLRAMPLPPPLDPTLHRRIRTLEPVLVAQPLPHTHGGMPLLAREPEIGGQPSLDDLGVPRIDRPALPAGRGEKSSLEAYFTTVVRDTCSSRAIRAWLMPCPSNCLIRCCISIDVVNPFLPGTSKTVTGTRESTGKPDGIDALFRNRPHRPK